MRSKQQLPKLPAHFPHMRSKQRLPKNVCSLSTHEIKTAASQIACSLSTHEIKTVASHMTSKQQLDLQELCLAHASFHHTLWPLPVHLPIQIKAMAEAAEHTALYTLLLIRHAVA